MAQTLYLVVHHGKSQRAWRIRIDRAGERDGIQRGAVDYQYGTGQQFD
jgi:hypothetical protein